MNTYNNTKSNVLDNESGRISLVVHIGGAKAGSTAIQDFLFANRNLLVEQGILVPNTNLDYAGGRANHVWFFQNLISVPQRASEVLDQKLKQARADYEQRHLTPPRAILLSAENLSNPHDLAEAFSGLKSQYNLAVLLYVRRQEDAYQSAWQQWFAKTGQELDSWLASTDGFFADWNGTLTRWEAIKPDVISVRLFDRSQLVGSDIRDDYCAVVGIDMQNLRQPTAEINSSFGVHVSDLYHGISEVFDGPHDLHVETEFYKHNIKAAEKHKNEWLFTREQLDLIRQRHAEGNREVKARYFPDLPGADLFAPVKDDEFINLPQSELNRRNIAVIGELIFKHQSEIDRRIDELSARFEEKSSALEGMVEAMKTNVSAIENKPGAQKKEKQWRRIKLLSKLSKSIQNRRDKLKNLGLEALRNDAASTKAARSAFIAAPPSFDEETKPRCAVVSMARNERDRAHEIMRHLCALFDQVVIIDHCSTDETGNIAAGYTAHPESNVVVLRSDESGYYQSEYMTTAANTLVASGQYDWVFFLDFDEFLPFATREAFHQALVQHADFDVINCHWLNCVPTGGNLSQIEGAKVVISETVSPYLKIGINARRLAGRDITICQGNHAVQIGSNPEHITGNRAFGIFHIPILSTDQMERKLKEGVSSYDALMRPAEGQGFHWRELQQRLGELKNDQAMLQSVALRYGNAMTDILAEHLNSGGNNIKSRPLTLKFAQTQKFNAASNFNVPRIDQTTLASTLGNLLPKASGDISDAARAQPFPAVYETLPPTNRFLPEGDRETRLRRAIFAAAQKIDVIVPTAWSNHAPFLFTLMEAIRPRRYVELGTHAGQSFFLACQHYKSNGNYGEAVGIDLWEGDHQAGFYDEKVFNNFKFLLNKHYPACGRYIRSLFTEAVKAFEEGSIDLLHIDGLHTYGAVREDYETWRSRLTKNGTIIFHDTSEFQTDFGVWQLLQEIREEATASFNFQHGHGLGVLAFGAADTNPAVELLNHMNEAPSTFERHYATLGHAMFQCARMDLQLGQGR